ncbi:MAG: transcription termination factor NusA [Calditrichaeota bacterium]|jgi:transcription termination/antitermination protein NusA|nr:transcription termination factor NusA [Calditrichota bacterium]MBT7788904.1 transcription termination factor NusA [Calditrichota bacterium]
MKHEVVDAVTTLLRDKGIDKETFQEIIESVFFSMIKRKYGESDNFSVTFNPEKGDIEIQCIKMVVANDADVDPATEVSLSVAKTYDPYAEIGEETVVMIDYEDEFGRRIIVSAKQHLVQRIREIEKENLYQEFSQRIGEIVIGDIHQINRHEIRLNIDKTEVIMPRTEQVYNERYRRGDSIKAIVLEARRTNRDPEIIVSRKSINFVRRLFELEVPEIFDGIVEIKSIAREAGDRTKIAVISNDKRVDPVGACVGMKGVRIQAIVKEMNREKIDIVHWSREPDLFIRRSLAPVIPLELVYIDNGTKVLAIIPDDSMPQLIGRKGQNIRLASQLTSFEIEPIRVSDYYQEELDLADVEGLSEGLVGVLKKNGFSSAEDVLNAERSSLMLLPNFNDEVIDYINRVLSGYFEESE